eukprot:GHVU01227884.1.p1 GENE.GHVU01227884.1~~GHVU01227884.1.p1  ORF type:complete len:505 (-),score=62.24 GHVU01227884.1:170-1684(-)
MELDIQATKVCEWLASRRKIPDDWQQQLAGLRLKTSRALGSSVPETEDLKGYLDKNRSMFSYAHVKDFLEMADKTEEGLKRDFLGNYSSPALKEWYSIRRAFEKKNMWLAANGADIAQLQQYDIPSLKKNRDCLDKELQDLEKRQADLSRGMDGADCALQQAMADFDVSPSSELPMDVQIRRHAESVVPALCTEVETSAKKLTGGIQFYDDFTKFVIEAAADEGSGAADAVPVVGLACLRAFAEVGNRPMQEFRRMRNFSLLLSETQSTAEEGPSSEAWDIVVEREGEEDLGAPGGGGGNDESESLRGRNDRTTGKENMLPAANSISTLRECETVLASAQFRRLLLDDLEEISSFLAQREKEMERSSSGTGNSSSTVMLPESLSIGIDAVRSWTSACRSCADSLSTGKLEGCLEIAQGGDGMRRYGLPGGRACRQAGVCSQAQCRRGSLLGSRVPGPHLSVRQAGRQVTLSPDLAVHWSRTSIVLSPHLGGAFVHERPCTRVSM